MVGTQAIALFAIFFSNISFIVMIVAWWRMRHRRMELQADLQAKLIDKFGSGAELVTFLQSPAGRQFVHGVQTGATVVTQERVLAGMRKSVILTFIGIGLLAVWGVSGASWVSWFGLMFVALGVGYLAAAFLSMRLSRGAQDAPSAGEMTPSS
ncbi:MAG: hypothetical protein JJE51_13370 [Thermoanaerobaculia bacterium]|nr:hypothetical protein [Thermoanaerobaculia bacterium]